MEDAKVFWISTVHPDGRPHVTPLIAVLSDGALYFCTGPRERKAENLALNPHCVLTTGCNSLEEGVDLVVEGHAAPVSDDAKLRHIADLYESKYGSQWRFGCAMDTSSMADAHEGGVTLVYEVTPRKVFAFRKSSKFSQTRWRFQ